jgi:hypothetical protein
MVQVFGDFLRYLYDCTQLFIEETHAGGSELWASVEARTEFVLTHPNGWEGAQQALMRSAAAYGGLVPDTPDGHARIHFVTEGEASLHYCIGNNYASELIKVFFYFRTTLFNLNKDGVHCRAAKASALSMLEEAP